MWNFCARAPSGFQYELNSHYITCVLRNTHSQHPLLGKIGNIIPFSKENFLFLSLSGSIVDPLNYRH